MNCSGHLVVYAGVVLVGAVPHGAIGGGERGTGFTDVTAAAGVVYSHQMDPPEDVGRMFMTGGAAAGDFDGDGYCDLFVTRLGDTDILYHNNGDGTFSDVSAASGFTAVRSTNGALCCDVDNDGDLDLYVMNVVYGNTHLMYINDGTGIFTEEGFVRGTSVETGIQHYGSSPAAGDIDKDGYLDLYVAEWGQLNPMMDPGFVSNARLLRNMGGAMAGYFEDVTDLAGVNVDDTVGVGVGGVSMHGVYLFSPRFTDMDLDGSVDLVIAGDFSTSRLFWNDGLGGFTDGTAGAGVGTDENGMGSAVGDMDGDGDLDWFVTSVYDPADTCATAGCNWAGSGNRMYRNEGAQTFTDVTDSFGVRDGGWGWGSEFFDFDNDGDLDLIMTNGMYLSFTTNEDPFNNDPIRLWRNDGGVYTEVAGASGLTDTGAGKGLLLFDYDNDGDQDVFIVNNPGTSVLYRNDIGSNNDWLRVKLGGTLSNRDGLGAKVYVTAVAGEARQMREVNAGSSYLACSESTAHFGLGTLVGSVHEVMILWPSGIKQTFNNVTANAVFSVTEPVCADDANGDGRYDVEDLIELTVAPVDLDGDQIADPGDARCMSRWVRREESGDMRAGRGG